MRQGSNSRAVFGVLSQCLTSRFLNLCPVCVSREKYDVGSAKISSENSEGNYLEIHNLRLLLLLRSSIAKVGFELLQNSVKQQPSMR